jgi:hypothetical protein
VKANRLVVWKYPSCFGCHVFVQADMTASIVFIWLSLNNNITSGWIKIEKMLTNVGKT